MKWLIRSYVLVGAHAILLHVKLGLQINVSFMTAPMERVCPQTDMQGLKIDSI